MSHCCTQTRPVESLDAIDDLRDERWQSIVEKLLSRRLRDQDIHEHELVEEMGIDPDRWARMLSPQGRFADEDELAELATALAVPVEVLPL